MNQNSDANWNIPQNVEDIAQEEQLVTHCISYHGVLHIMFNCECIVKVLLLTKAIMQNDKFLKKAEVCFCACHTNKVTI